MSTVIIVVAASLIEGIYDTIASFVKAKVFKYESNKKRGCVRHAEWKTRLKYKIEDCWDYLITPR